MTAPPKPSTKVIEIRRFFGIALLFPTLAFAQTAQNPLLNPSSLQYQAPLFDKLKDTDYQPAIDEGMKRNLVEIDAIANSSEAPTFANTIEPMERSGAPLTRAAKIFFG